MICLNTKLLRMEEVVHVTIATSLLQGGRGQSLESVTYSGTEYSRLPIMTITSVLDNHVSARQSHQCLTITSVLIWQSAMHTSEATSIPDCTATISFMLSEPKQSTQSVHQWCKQCSSFLLMLSGSVLQHPVSILH